MDLDFSKIISKIQDKFRDSNWYPILNKFIDSKSFVRILKVAKKMTENGRFITPELGYWFRAFEECPYEDVKVVIIGQDPYPNLGVADGIAFSSSRNPNIPFSLAYIFEEIKKQYGYVTVDTDLTRWANQGVLMLNCALTTEVNKIGAHYHLWDKFVGYILYTLAKEDRDILFVFLGNEAFHLKKYIGAQPYYKRTHPNIAKYRGGSWNSDNLFLMINGWLKSKELQPVLWN